MMRRCALALGFCGPVLMCAQTFDLDQFDQLFRPRLRLEGRWLPQVPVQREPGNYEDRSAMEVMTFPIHSTFNINAKLDLTAENIGELLKNGLRVRASQVMGNLRYGTRQVMFDAALGGPRTMHTASAGALGVSLTRKFRVLFWSLNVNVSEEGRTFDRAVPRFTGLIGKMKVKGLRRQFFYGLAASYSDGLPLPIPFIGGNAPTGDSWSFNYVLPLQASFTRKCGQRTRLSLGTGLEAARSGIELGDQRYNINYTGLRLFASVRHRLSKHFALRAEVGQMLRHRVSFGTSGLEDTDPPYQLGPGIQCMVGLNVLFGQSILDRIMDEVLK